MVIKEGYKQTEIGVIPKDWLDLTFKDICWVNQGLQIPISQRLIFPNKNSKVYITIQCLNDGKTIEYIDDYASSVCCDKNDILMTRTGNTGIVVSGVEGVFHNNFFKINIDKLKIDKDYVIYYLNQPKTKKIILAKAGTSTIPDLNHRDFYSLPIPLPPTLTEQTAISNALSDADVLITCLEKLIAKKRNIKQGAMQQLLQPKEGWEVKKFKDLCWFQEGPGLRNWQFTKRGIKVINVTNLENGILNLERTSRHISIDEFNKMYQHFEIDEKDIVVASSGNSYGKVAVVRKQDLPLVMNTSVIRFKPFESLDYNYLFIFLKSVHFKEQIDLLITGGAQPNFGPVHLNRIVINLPPSKEEQIRIASILTDMDAELSALEQKLEKYKKVKLGMMQELLTGKTRLV